MSSLSEQAAVNTDTRSCTCHPDDNPPTPCPRKFALTECRLAAAESEVSRLTEEVEKLTKEAARGLGERFGIAVDASFAEREIARLTERVETAERAEREMTFQHARRGDVAMRLSEEVERLTTLLTASRGRDAGEVTRELVETHDKRWAKPALNGFSWAERWPAMAYDLSEDITAAILSERAEAEKMRKALEPLAENARQLLKSCVRGDGSIWFDDDSHWTVRLDDTRSGKITGKQLRELAALPALPAQAGAAAELARLRKALEPFAKKAIEWEQRHPPRGQYPVSDAMQITHRLGDFRNARAALAPEQTDAE